ncbi:hypothetical protein FRC15_002604 [Serendipita sp. 397]|nr:hypothetical protein FRC15_002604 [Serendipita sp. 397]
MMSNCRRDDDTSLEPSFHDNPSTASSEEEQTLATAEEPMGAVTHGVNRLSECLDGVDRQRVAGHDDAKG